MDSGPMVQIIIGIKNRYDYRIENSLHSLRSQTVADKIGIILVDYSSDKKYKKDFQKICAKYDIKGVWTGGDLKWNRSHALNIGIRQATAKYVLLSDVDIIFAPDYIETCLGVISNDPHSIVYSRMNDLPEGSIDKLIKYPEDYLVYKNQTISRASNYNNTNFPFGSSIMFLEKKYTEIIRGLDQNYLLWGNEERDLLKRLLVFGLRLVPIDQYTSHLHQWHPKFENVLEDADYKNQIKKNEEYFNRVNTIIRNDENWGTY